ncbi:MAG: hypothetical protein ABI843_11710 [Dokdonella sp.]
MQNQIANTFDEYDAYLMSQPQVSRLADRFDSQRRKASAASRNIVDILVKASHLNEEELASFLAHVSDRSVNEAIWRLRTLGPSLLAGQAAYGLGLEAVATAS